jgi:hypothetical protein
MGYSETSYREMAKGLFSDEPDGKKNGSVTTQPDVQVYTGNWKDKQTGKKGKF